MALWGWKQEEEEAGAENRSAEGREDESWGVYSICVSWSVFYVLLNFNLNSINV